MASLRLTFAPDIEELARLADAVEEFATANDLDLVVALRLTTALDEILTNVMSYGGLPAGSAIEVALDHRPDQLDAVVTDSGPAFDPLAVATPADLQAGLEDRQIGGLGLHIVRGLVDEIVYARTAQGLNQLTLRMRL